MSLPLLDSITIYRGDDFSRAYELATGTTTSNTPIDLTGATITAQIRKTATSATPLASFAVANRNDALGSFTLELSNAVTAALPVTGEGFWVFDIQVDQAGYITTYVSGEVAVVADVTRGA